MLPSGKQWKCLVPCMCMLPSGKQWKCVVPYICMLPSWKLTMKMSGPIHMYATIRKTMKMSGSHAYVCYHQENSMSGPIHGRNTWWCCPEEGRQQWTGFLCACMYNCDKGWQQAILGHGDSNIITQLSVAFRNAFHAASAGPLSRMDLAGLALPMLRLLLSNTQRRNDF